MRNMDWELCPTIIRNDHWQLLRTFLEDRPTNTMNVYFTKFESLKLLHILRLQTQVHILSKLKYYYIYITFKLVYNQINDYYQYSIWLTISVWKCFRIVFIVIWLFPKHVPVNEHNSLVRKTDGFSNVFCELD